MIGHGHPSSIINARGGYATSKTASDYLVQRLYDWAIHRLNGSYDAKMLGPDGIEIDNPEQTGPAWEAAFGADRPCW